MAVEPASRLEAMEAFYREIQARRLDALWRLQGGGGGPVGPAEVSAPYEPCHWRASDIGPFIRRAGELVEPSGEDQRRALTLQNPSVRPTGTTTHTISAAVQMVLPGETAPSHRHTMAAIRFVMEGDGAVTFIDGEGCSMHPGDLILTPGWTWHGHINRTSGPMIWMDLLDVPLVVGLKAGLYEDYPDQLYPSTKPVDDSLSRLGIGHLRPVGETGPSVISPLLSFPWTTTERALHELAKTEANPFDDVALEYTNPSTGGHVLPTIGCFIQMLRPSVHTKAHKHSTVTVYHAFRGRGATIVDGVQLNWEQGDFFALPPWCMHEHVNTSASEEAVLFSCSDRPVFDSLNLYRELPYESNGGHQTVTAQYAERYGYEGAPAPARH